MQRASLDRFVVYAKLQNGSLKPVANRVFLFHFVRIGAHAHRTSPPLCVRVKGDLISLKLSRRTAKSRFPRFSLRIFLRWPNFPPFSRLNRSLRDRCKNTAWARFIKKAFVVKRATRASKTKYKNNARVCLLYLRMFSCFARRKRFSGQLCFARESERGIFTMSADGDYSPRLISHEGRLRGIAWMTLS